MNYLELVQRTVREAGINLTGPTATTGQSGTTYQRVVDWVQSAYAEIQMLHDDWRFMWRPFSLTCTPADGSYSKTEVDSGYTVARFDSDSLRCYLQSSGQVAEQRMWFYDYDHFRETFMYGATRTTPGQPQYWTQAPDKALLLYPIPGPDVYVVTGEYYRTVDVLTGDSDEPIFDSDYHMLIVYWAVWKYAGFEETSSAYLNAQNQANQYIGRMERLERPTVRRGEPLA